MLKNVRIHLLILSMMCGINVLQANYFGRSFQWKNAHPYAKGIFK